MLLFRIVLGLAGVVLVWIGMRWLAKAKPAHVAKALRLVGLAALVGFGLFLVVTGRLAGIFAVLAGLAPWLARAMRLHALYKMARGHLGGGRPAAGSTSAVETRFLRMELDHDSGRLDGAILDGPWRGRRLSQLDRDEALDLWRFVQADPQSVQVLEAWLDRAFPDWRDSPPPAAAGGAMTRDEAYEVLGLAPGATPEDIREAHRRLMRLAHPDAGGSTWIAARLNQARDLLLG